jgi:hypothetical protein
LYCAEFVDPSFKSASVTTISKKGLYYSRPLKLLGSFSGSSCDIKITVSNLWFWSPGTSLRENGLSMEESVSTASPYTSKSAQTTTPAMQSTVYIVLYTFFTSQSICIKAHFNFLLNGSGSVFAPMWIAGSYGTRQRTP